MGISDGEYEIVAMAAAPPGGDFLFSRVQHVTVRGTDVVGMELALAPVGSITGRVVIERDPQLNCGTRRDTALREIVITTRRDPIADQRGAKTSRDKSLETAAPSFLFPSFLEVAQNDKGEITRAIWRREIIASKRVCRAAVGTSSRSAWAPPIKRQRLGFRRRT